MSENRREKRPKTECGHSNIKKYTSTGRGKKLAKNTEKSQPEKKNQKEMMGRCAF